MQIIEGGRRSGKTTNIIMNAANNNGYIVCANIDEACRVASLAIELGVKINHPITFDEFVNQKYGIIKCFHIDNADKLLKRLGLYQIESISINKEKTSKDYSILYKKIMDGEKVPCWVEYKTGGVGHKCRDITFCSKFGKTKEIKFLSRGMCYGSLDDYLEIDDKKKAFNELCKYLNVEWIA